ncbi:MAG: hypothetical protein R2787_16510 [Saprospiraceae bacterium]
MNEAQVHRLLHALPGQASLVETHISWVLLTDDRVYKIRKPIRYAFLDFSTLEQRRVDCEKELELNRRTSPQIYLGVVPIRQWEGGVGLGEGPGQVIDHAVAMVRMPEGRQMNLLVKEHRVSEEDMRQLARHLANFHAGATLIDTPVSVHGLWLDVADILKVELVTEEVLGKEAALALRDHVRMAREQLHTLRQRIQDRHQAGWTRDVHGDLHTRNLFLLPEPVLFDCLEFNDHLRQIDLLNEIAFLGMDLGSLGRMDLWDVFLAAYQEVLPVMEDELDRKLLGFYMGYRANVRFKVAMLRVMQSPDQLDIHGLQGSFAYAMRLMDDLSR